MKQIFIALAVFALGTSINFCGIIADSGAPEAALSSGASIVNEIVGNRPGLFGCLIQVASENGEDDNGDNGNGKEEAAGGNPLEGGIERIWNAAQLA